MRNYALIHFHGEATTWSQMHGKLFIGWDADGFLHIILRELGGIGAIKISPIIVPVILRVVIDIPHSMCLFVESLQ